MSEHEYGIINFPGALAVPQRPALPRPQHCLLAVPPLHLVGVGGAVGQGRSGGGGGARGGERAGAGAGFCGVWD